MRQQRSFTSAVPVPLASAARLAVTAGLALPVASQPAPSYLS
jgi:hypothetical protein